jgi:putative tryptophan/tyrosine transport system substrate-binding protein
VVLGQGSKSREAAEFIRFFSITVVAWPLTARAQQPALPVIGFLSSESAATWTEFVAAFHEGLSQTGYVEGRNLAIEYRWANGQNNRLPPLAADLVHRQVAVIVANGPAAVAAKAATTNIPIVFEMAGDPVELGLVTSLARPGGNLTGVTSLNEELGAKLLELLHELVPRATIIGLLVNSNNPNVAEPTTKSLQVVAGTLGLETHVLHASADDDFDAAFATLVQLRANALVIGPDPFFFSRREQLGALAFRHAIPTIRIASSLLPVV